MDPNRFDALAKHLAQPPSRRAILKSLGGALGAAGVALLGGGAAQAASCGSDRDCSHSRCFNGHCRGAGNEADQPGGGPQRCRARDEMCHRNNECCSNHCRLVSADPMRGRCT